MICLMIKPDIRYDYVVGEVKISPAVNLKLLEDVIIIPERRAPGGSYCPQDTHVIMCDFKRSHDLKYTSHPISSERCNLTESALDVLLLEILII